MNTSTAAEEARSLVEVILKASDITKRLEERLEVLASKLRGRRVLVAIGKASVPMALTALRRLDGLLDGGVVVTPKGSETLTGSLGPLEVMRSSHPLPSEDSVRAADSVLEWSRAARSVDGLLALISGGGSALVEKPLVDYVTIDDLVLLNKALLASGATISQMNTVRRHVSRVKGGRVSLEAYPAHVLGLYASDVPGDRLEDISSGPTAPDPTTYADALRVLSLFGLERSVPKPIVRLLKEGASGAVPETMKPGSPESARSENYIIASNVDVLRSVVEELRARSYNVLPLTSMAQGESREVGRLLASITAEIVKRGFPVSPPAAIVLGGETTVTVKGSGKGGRNQELALSWAIETYNLGVEPERAALLALATDGIDGPTDAAGALVTPGTAEALYSRGIDPVSYLNNNDSYTALSEVNALVKTGPTGSNLNNVIVIIVR